MFKFYNNSDTFNILETMTNVYFGMKSRKKQKLAESKSSIIKVLYGEHKQNERFSK